MTTAAEPLPVSQITVALPMAPQRWLDIDQRGRDGVRAQNALEALVEVLRAKRVRIGQGGPNLEFLRALHVSAVGKPSLRIDACVLKEPPNPHAITLSHEELAEVNVRGLSAATMARRRYLKTEPTFVEVDAAGVDRLIAANAELRRRRVIVEAEDAAETAAKEAAQARAVIVEAQRREHDARYAKWQKMARAAQFCEAATAALPEFTAVFEVIGRLLENEHSVPMPPGWKPR